MRKTLLIVIIIIFLISLANSKNSEEIKVRIVPNSNSYQDLKTKEMVKDAVVYYLSKIYDESFEIYEKNINDSVKELNEIIQIEYGSCNVSFDYHTLYNKTYNGNKVKDEKTLVLLVVLGEGKGDNWWGSIYPEYLCVSSNEEYKYESLFIKLINKIRGK